MKRYLSFFLFVLIILFCSSCSLKNDYEGLWYSANTGDEYEFFHEGGIYCEENHITVDDGLTSGSYTINNDCINAYIVGHTSPDTLLCIVNIDGNEALANKETGTIYFYRDKAVAEKAIEDEKNLTNKKFKYCNSFNDDTNNIISWEGMKAKVPHTWEGPEYEDSNIIRISAEGSSTYLAKFDVGESQNNTDELLSNQQTLIRINTELTDFFVEQRHSNSEHDLEHPNFKYIDNMYYQKGTHPVIKNKEILMIKHSADYERFTTYCFVVGENMYSWTVIEWSNNIYSPIKDFEKVINTVEVNDATHNQDENENNTSSTNTDKTSQINVTFSKDAIDGNNMRLKVYVKNTSQSKFSGDVHIYFYSADRKTKLGSDTIIVKDLMPGQQSWSNININKYSGTPLMEKEFTNVKFTNLESSSNTLDDYKTEKTKNSVRLNFDIANWYKNIKSIKVYTDGICEVIVTSSSDDTVIASSVWSCGHEYGVKSVKVLDQNGKILAVFSK